MRMEPSVVKEFFERDKNDVNKNIHQLDDIFSNILAVCISVFLYEMSILPFFVFDKKFVSPISHFVERVSRKNG